MYTVLIILSALTLASSLTLVGSSATHYSVSAHKNAKRDGVIGMVTGISSAVLVFIGVAFVWGNGDEPRLITAIATSAVLLAFLVLDVMVQVFILGIFRTRAVKRKTRDLPEEVRTVILHGHHGLGFRRAYIAAVMGCHPSNPPVLRGWYHSHVHRDFLDASPAIEWPITRTDELNELIWAAVQACDDKGDEVTAVPLDKCFEDVYMALVPFSGRITDENIDAVMQVARTYGPSSAVHLLDGDMPLEYLHALGATTLPERRTFWWVNN